MKLIAAFAASVLVSGCASYSTETKIEESVYQVVSAADVAQSIQISKHPEHYAEVGIITKDVIGSHPSVAATVAWGAARGGLHWLITDQLEKHEASPWVKRVWQAVSIGVEADAVHSNWQIGLHFGNAYPSSGSRSANESVHCTSNICN